MAHRRALVRHRGWALWLVVPLVLALDGATALGLAGHRLVFGVVVPEAFLLTAPLLAYGGLAFLAFRTRPVSVRLAAAAVLLGLHAGLVVGHTLVFANLWSLPMPAALRLAHRWSPLIPLLQLVWVPLLALPLARLAQMPAATPWRRGVTASARRDILASRGVPTGQRGRAGPDRDLAGESSEHAIVPLATVGTMPTALSEPLADPPAAPPVASPVTRAVPLAVVPTVPVVEEPSAALPLPAATELEPPAAPPTPMVVVHDLDTDEPILTSVVTGPTPAEPTVAEPAAPGAQDKVEPTEAPTAVSVPSVDHAVLLVEQPPPVSLPATPVAVGSTDAVVVLSGDTREPRDSSDPESRQVPEAAPVPAPLALVPAPPVEPPVVAAKPPLDLYTVARLFEPYGSLLSRDGTVQVDWAPRPDAVIVCVSPRDVARERMLNLASRLARALNVASRPSTSPPVRRLSLRGTEGVAVLTPLDGGMLVAAASRPGAAALLEVLSARIVPGPLGVGASVTGSVDALAAQEIRVSDAVRVETPAARVDVLAAPGIGAESLGELAVRLLAVIAEEGDDRTLHALSVDLGAQRLMVHSVSPHVRPRRFVAVVGGPELPGLLSRRAERAARTLREVS